MEPLLTNSFFINGVIPLLTVFLSIVFRWTSRNDRHEIGVIGLTKSDFAIGLEVLATSILLLVMTSALQAKQLQMSGADSKVIAERLLFFPWMLLLLIIVTLFVTILIRKGGWDENGEYRLWRGVIIPDAIGLSMLLFVVSKIG